MTVSVEEDIQGALVKMYGASAKWKSEEQKQAVMATVEGVNELFIILPTGAGKSLTFMLPTMQKHA